MSSLKILFLIFFSIAGLGSIWIGGKFFYHLHDYYHFSHSQYVEIDQWEIAEVESGQFALVALYSFEKAGAFYPNRFQFPKPIYLNPYQAQDHIERWKKKSWQVWYNPANPHNSSLQKLFPFKKGIHLLFCLGILFYFFWLKHCVLSTYKETQHLKNQAPPNERPSLAGKGSRGEKKPATPEKKKRFQMPF